MKKLGILTIGFFMSLSGIFASEMEWVNWLKSMDHDPKQIVKEEVRDRLDKTIPQEQARYELAKDRNSQTEAWQRINTRKNARMYIDSPYNKSYYPLKLAADRDVQNSKDLLEAAKAKFLTAQKMRATIESFPPGRKRDMEMQRFNQFTGYEGNDPTAILQLLQNDMMDKLHQYQDHLKDQEMYTRAYNVIHEK